MDLRLESKLVVAAFPDNMLQRNHLEDQINSFVLK
jgi:hypothetical protein